MNDNLILAVAIGAAVFLVVKKQGQAIASQTGLSQTGRPLTLEEKQKLGLVANTNPQTTANMNGDYWARLLGTGFAAAGSSGLLKNIFGQTATSDGKPISGNDPLVAFNNAMNGRPSEDADYVGDLFPITSDVMEWGQYTNGDGATRGSFLGLF